VYGFVFKLVKDDKEMEELKLTGLEGVPILKMKRKV